MIVVSGKLEPVERLTELDVEPGSQRYAIEVEHVKSLILPLIEGYRASGAEQVQYRASGALGKITARYGGAAPGATEIPQDVISLKSSEITQSIYLHPRYAGIPSQIITAVRRAVESGEKYSDMTGEVAQAVIDAGASAAIETLAFELFDMVIGGTDGYQVAVRTITRTRTVSKRFNTSVSQADVEKLFTKAQLAGYLASALPFEVPVLTLNADETAKGLMEAWRKTSCDVDDTAGGARQLVESWALAKWSTKLYEVKAA